MTNYLLKQIGFIYGGKGSLDGEFYTYRIIQDCPTVEQYIEDMIKFIRENSDDYTGNFSQDYYEEAILECGLENYVDDVEGPDDRYDSRTRGLDGYARTFEPADAVEILGEISDKEIETLKKFGIL